MLRAAIFLLALISGLFFPTHDSFATTSVVTVPATVEIVYIVNPENPLNCGVLAFAKWHKVDGEVSATVDYTNDGSARSVTRPAQFDNYKVAIGVTLEAPSFNNWIVIGSFYAAGAGARAYCNTKEDEFTSKFGTSATVRLQVTTKDPPLDPDACEAARRRTLKASKKVADIRSQIRKLSAGGKTPSPYKKSALTKRLNDAKRKYQALKEAQLVACDSGLLG